MGSWTSANNRISQEKSLDLLALSGVNSIIGRSVVLHAMEDSCTGDSGDAGARYAFGVIGIENEQDPEEENDAQSSFAASQLVCQLKPTSECGTCSGTVWFSQREDGIQVVGRVSGLEHGSVHGLHIHTYGDLSKADGTGLGGHWNPDGFSHDLPPNEFRHEGDMGNLQDYSGNLGWYSYLNTRIPSMSRIIGRGVVLHETLDHGNGIGCDPNTGNAGARWATCVIGVASDGQIVPDVPIQVSNDWEDEVCGFSSSISVLPTSIDSSVFESSLFTNSIPDYGEYSPVAELSPTGQGSSPLEFGALLLLLALLVLV